MSDTLDKTSTEDDATQNDDATDDAVDFKAEAEKWKALARKHERQAKENSSAAKRLKELEDADKTESQKAAERAEAAEKRAAEAEQRAIRLEIAAAKGLTPAQAKRLVGSTAEELEADADELLATFKTADTDGPSDTEKPGKPKERLRPGAAPDVEPEDNDPKSLAASIPRDAI